MATSIGPCQTAKNQLHLVSWVLRCDHLRPKPGCGFGSLPGFSWRTQKPETSCGQQMATDGLWAMGLRRYSFWGRPNAPGTFLGLRFGGWVSCYPHHWTISRWFLVNRGPSSWRKSLLPRQRGSNFSILAGEVFQMLHAYCSSCVVLEGVAEQPSSAGTLGWLKRMVTWATPIWGNPYINLDDRTWPLNISNRLPQDQRLVGRWLYGARALDVVDSHPGNTWGWPTKMVMLELEATSTWKGKWLSTMPD